MKLPVWYNNSKPTSTLFRTCGAEGGICSVDGENGKQSTHTAELQQVEDDDGAGDKQGLTGLDTIDAR